MKIAVLTSSRADYGIYQPLLTALSADQYFEVELIAFGTHLSELHGRTISGIEQDGYPVYATIPFLASDDSPLGISNSIAKNIEAFGPIWKNSNHELIIALGDRYEMFSAVTSALVFGKRVAHIHGGETTLGAIDNAFRHSISHMSDIHFTCAEAYRERVIELVGSDRNVFNVGALSMDTLASTSLMDKGTFNKEFGIDLNAPTVLITMHPETVDLHKNATNAKELCAALHEMGEFQLVITMPNADTMGNVIREELTTFIGDHDNAIGVENFGALGYLSCMNHCSFMLGNTSSGFGEASFFPTPVINIGNRQAGRIRTPNIMDVAINKEQILNAVERIAQLRDTERSYVYGNGNAAKNIIQILMTAI